MTGIQRVLGMGAAVAAGWLCRESYRGHSIKWRERFHAHEEEEMLDLTRKGFGHYSGQPAMDGWSVALEKIRKFGFFGSKVDFMKAKCYVEGFVNDVLLRNMLPIAVGIGGLYAAIGNHLFTPFTATWNYAVNSTFFPAAGRAIGQALSVAGRGLLRGTEALMTQFSRGGPGAAAFAAILGLVLYRFWRVDNHLEQHDYFKDIVLGGHDH